MKREGKAPIQADSSGLVGGGVSDTAIRKATGKGWGEWYDLLDAAGARAMSHQQIVSEIARQGPGSWWQQLIATAYEQSRSLRERQNGEDGFAASTSKVINAGVTRVYAAWTEQELRASWLDASGWNVRKATPCKSLRITWKDGRTHLEVALHPRGVGKTFVQVEHSKLPTLDDVQRLKAFWGVALERLRELLETAEQPQSLAA